MTAAQLEYLRGVANDSPEAMPRFSSHMMHECDDAGWTVASGDTRTGSMLTDAGRDELRRAESKGEVET